MDSVTVALKELRDLESKLPMHRGIRTIEMDAKEKLKDLVSTREEYDAKFSEIVKMLQDEDKKIREVSAQKVREKWSEIKLMVSQDEGVSESPKLDTAWSLAWEKGHSAGYEEVVSEFRGLAELIK